MKKIWFFSLILFVCKLVNSQNISLLTSGQKTSLRGLSVVNNNIIWTSGSNGMVGKSVDGGKTFRWIQVPGFEKRDFRDVEAFDSSTALIMAVAEPALILKTYDGGKNWKKVFEDTTIGMFLDAMDFDGVNGVVVGDPILDKVFLAQTTNFGDTWVVQQKQTNCSMMKKGEAFFASSGSNVKMNQTQKKQADFFYISGGVQSRFFIGDKCYSLNLQKGKSSTGANSVDYFSSKKKGIIVGGDFANDRRTDSACILFSLNKNPVFSLPETPLNGYRSAVCYITDLNIIACGTSGIDFSVDGGKNWKLISEIGFHVVKKAKTGEAVFLVGSNGRVAKLFSK